MMTNRLTAVSLFTGAGGMDIGFEKAGVEVVFANELMAEAAATYNANHTEGVMLNADINDVIGDIEKLRGVDLVFGGPPCQGFSVAGKMDPDDDRSKLIFTFLDRYVKSIGFMRFTPLFLFLKLPNNSQQNPKCDSQKYSQSRKIGI